MTMEELVAFARLAEKRFKAMNKDNASDKERLYAQTVKLGEEFGELCEAIMAHAGDQRKEKLEQHSPQKLKEELADCVVVLFILAEKLQVDLPQALREKTAILQDRYKDIGVE